MTIWLISDTHFGHDNMYRFVTADGVTRVRSRFLSAKEGDEYMCDMWAQTVKPEDHIYHLGDVAMSQAAVFNVKNLPGHKRLVLGNHDKEKMHTYRDAGFQKIMLCRFINGMLLTHMPVHRMSFGRATINVHGHIHALPPYGPDYRNVSVERTDYCPIALDSVLRMC